MGYRINPYQFLLHRHLTVDKALTDNYRRMLSQSSRLARPKTLIRWPWSRKYATKTPPPTTSSLSRFEARLPRFLRNVTTPLRNSPVSHITAFLILHEITAIVPLFGLTAFFHYTDYLPKSLSEGKWVQDGTEKFGRWLRKKGWISQEETDASVAELHNNEHAREMTKDRGVKIVVELATAYAITKAMLPARLLVSVWGTPWFARWTVLPITNIMQRILG
ncbi:Hypothetical protein R9X50_00675400 [Acrodontium crateriforme]|uniref:Uncharacterized protein n=1 Tax=Acrodontium crateriforme TaxID=150365 RepID=A0AAQ3RBS0_9PEZI|nr:Hypothetical protein R9X50_00675400 [Acrodontium crateriforme]